MWNTLNIERDTERLSALNLKGIMRKISVICRRDLEGILAMLWY